MLHHWGQAGFDRFVTHVQRRYARQAQLAQAAAAEYLAGLVEWQPIKAGMFMWCTLTGRQPSQRGIWAVASLLSKPTRTGLTCS